MLKALQKTSIRIFGDGPINSKDHVSKGSTSTGLKTSRPKAYANTLSHFQTLEDHDGIP